jgi:3,4-dihydroxy 2-butanone 4-phosphate synthase
MSASRIDSLKLPQMVEKNSESHQTAFTVSVDYSPGSSTGISAADRAATIQALANSEITTDKFNKPGHVFPLRAKAGGVLERPGHTEASVDLARLAGLSPAGAICEMQNRDGTMSRAPELKRFAEKHKIPLLYITDLIAYRKHLGHQGTSDDWYAD